MAKESKKDNLNLKGGLDDILKLAVKKEVRPKRVKRKRIKRKSN